MRPAWERCTSMRRSSPKSRIRYFACRPTPSNSRPTNASGGGSYVLRPVKPSGSYPVKRRTVEPRREPFGQRLHLGSFRHGSTRAPRLSSRGHPRPLGSSHCARALGRMFGIELLARRRVTLRRLDAFRERPEVFLQREHAVARVLQHGDAGEVDRRARRVRDCRAGSACRRRPDRSSSTMCHSYAV